MFSLAGCYSSHELGTDDEVPVELADEPWDLASCRPRFEEPLFVGETRHPANPYAQAWSGSRVLVALTGHESAAVAAIERDGSVTVHPSPVAYTALTARDGRVVGGGASYRDLEYGAWGLWELRTDGRPLRALGFAGSSRGRLMSPWFTLGWHGADLVVMATDAGSGAFEVGDDRPSRAFGWVGAIDRIPDAAESTFLGEDVPTIWDLARDARGETPFGAASTGGAVVRFDPNTLGTSTLLETDHVLSAVFATDRGEFAIVEREEPLLLDLRTGATRSADLPDAPVGETVWTRGGRVFVTGWSDGEAVLREYSGDLATRSAEITIARDLPAPRGRPSTAVTPIPCGFAVHEHRPFERPRDGALLFEVRHQAFDCCP